MSDKQRARKAGTKAKTHSRPKVILPKVARPEGEFADSVGKILAKNEVLFRSEENHAAEIVNERFTGELDKFKLARGGLKFQPMTHVRLRTWIEQYIETGVNGENGFVPKTMPEVTARAVLAAPQFLKQIPRVIRILDVPLPIRTPDGDIIYPRPGLNAELGIYCNPSTPKLERYPIEQAKEILKEIYLGFCWQNPQSETHAIARLLTPYARGLMGWGGTLAIVVF